MMRSVLPILAAFLLLCFSSTDALADDGCSGKPIQAYSPVPNPADTEPPGVPVVTDVLVQRENAPKDSLCIAIGSIGLTITPPSDDVTSGADLGYVVTYGSGTLDEQVFMDGLGEDHPYELIDGKLWINFYDDAHNPLDATFSVAAVDEAGNLGQASQAIQAEDPGKDGGGGCATTGGQSLGFLIILACASWIRRKGR